MILTFNMIVAGIIAFIIGYIIGNIRGKKKIKKKMFRVIGSGKGKYLQYDPNK